jgi:hypothetical protein
MEGLVIVGLTSFVAPLVGIGVLGENRGWIAGGFAGALGALIRISWPVRKEAWFWWAVAVFASLDLFGLIHFDWSATHSWSGLAFGSFIFLDFAVMTAIIYLLFRSKYGTPTQAVADKPKRYGERNIDL